MLTFSKTKRTISYPSSSVIHLPTNEYMLNVSSPFKNNYQFLFDETTSNEPYLPMKGEY